MQFYTQNVCHIRKKKKKIKINLDARTNNHEAAKLAVNNWHDTGINITSNSNNDTNNNYANLDLAKFGVHTKILLVENVKKTHCR